MPLLIETLILQVKHINLNNYVQVKLNCKLTFIRMAYIIYTGGKILARFDCPAHKFLFPGGNKAEDDEHRILILNQARHYRVMATYC